MKTDTKCMLTPTVFKITSIIIISLLLLNACTVSTNSEELAKENPPPNIVFILADDLGWNEVGFNRSGISLTPYIDNLRTSGVSMTQFYVHAVCGPSRAALLTGRYPYRNWTDWRTEDFGKPNYLAMLGLGLLQNELGEETRRIHALATEEKTIAEALKEQGYSTAIAGKWGCGEWLSEHLPMAQGFDHQYGHYAWGIDYNNYTIPHNAPARFAVYDWHRNQQPLFEQGYSTDLIANEVVRLIQNHADNTNNTPFFFYVPFNAVHGPLEDIPRYVDESDKRTAAIKCLDDAVGRITNAIDQYGLSDNTLIVFTNDNGAIRDTMNAPYRGTKNTNYEGGVRVPCVINWPGKISPGSSNNSLMHVTDFYHTLISLGGGAVDQADPVDSYDFSEVILNGEESQQRQEIIFEVSGSVRPPAIRLGDYKLIGDELFNINSDPGEKDDISSEHPEVVAKLRNRIEQESAKRPPLPQMRLMTPALPWVYGEQENKLVPYWVKQLVQTVRNQQPQEWKPGETPWPQPPKDGKIIYTGDGR